MSGLPLIGLLPWPRIRLAAAAAAPVGGGGGDGTGVGTGAAALIPCGGGTHPTQHAPPLGF